jgi:hypothetical protein
MRFVTGLLRAAVVGALIAVVFLPGTALAGDAQVPVVIGSVECFVVRCPDGELSAADRVDQIHEVFAKHLGSPTGEFAIRKAPKKGSTKLQILLNGDPVINVTSNDAHATRFKKPEEVAAIWMKALKYAFEETHVRAESQHE